MFLFFLILIVIGAVNVLTPQVIWRVRYGKATPVSSETHSSFLVISQLTGMLALLGALLLLMSGAISDSSR